MKRKEVVKFQDVPVPVFKRIVDLFFALKLLYNCKLKVENGEHYFLLVIYAQLRAILTDTTQYRKQKKPLLLELSEELNIPITFFYNPLLDEKSNLVCFGDIVFLNYDLQLTAKRINEIQNEASLDKIIEKTVLIYKGTEYSFNALIEKLSNKLGGAHYDSEIPENYAELKHISWGKIAKVDEYLLKFIDALIPACIKIPNNMAEFHLSFGFIIYSIPKDKMCLLDFCVFNNMSRFSLSIVNRSLILEINDIVGNKIEANLSELFRVRRNKQIYININHRINDSVCSELEVVVNAKKSKKINIDYIIISTDLNKSKITANKRVDCKPQNFKLGLLNFLLRSGTLNSKEIEQEVYFFKDLRMNPKIINKNEFMDLLPNKSKIQNDILIN